MTTNREKFQKIGRSDRLLHPEDRKKQSLAKLFSNWDKKKQHTHKEQSLIRLLLALHSENLVGKFEIHMILLSLYSIYLSTSLHLSEVSGIFDLFANLSLSKWKCYVIWHIQNNETVKIIALHAWAVCWVVMKKSIHKVSDGQRFPCFLAERTWEKAWYFTTFFHGRCLHGCLPTRSEQQSKTRAPVLFIYR